MRKFLKGTCLSAVTAALILLPLPGQAHSLQEALAAAYLNSNLLEQNRALLRAQDEQVAVALSALRPQVSGSASVSQRDQASRFEGGDLSATIALAIDLLVFDNGVTQLSIDAAKETVLAVRQGLISVEQQVLLNAVSAYVSVLRDLRVVELRETNLRLITQELRAAQDRFDVGEVTRTDVAQAEARLAEARGTLAEAQGNLAISRAAYRTAIGEEPHGGAMIKLPKLPRSLDAAIAEGERRSPDIQALRHEIRANELNAERAQAAIGPRLSLRGEAAHNTRIDNNSSLSLNLTMPIYQGGQLQALRRQALASVHASRAELHQQVLLTRQAVSDAWSQLAVARAQVEASDRQIRAAQIAFDGVREEAKLGARTTLDVLDAEQALADARTNRVVAETQVYLASYSVLQSIGLLTVSELGLNVPQYDPSEYFNAAKTAPVSLSAQGQKLDRILQRYQNK